MFQKEIQVETTPVQGYNQLVKDLGIKDCISYGWNRWYACSCLRGTRFNAELIRRTNLGTRCFVTCKSIKSNYDLANRQHALKLDRKSFRRAQSA